MRGQSHSPPMQVLHIVASVSLLFIPFAEADCPSQPLPPIEIPIRNVSLTNSLVRRGVALSVGTAAQPLAFEVSPYWENTYVYDGHSFCDSSAADQCIAFSGGFFDPVSSTTWEYAANMAASGASPDHDSQGSQNVWGTDTVTINSTLAVADVAVGITRTDAHDFNMMGLGPNSTLLTALASMGAIASKTWSIALGWQGAESAYQTDGSLVIGGYDSAKTDGANFTYPFTDGTPCPGGLIVTISDVIANLKNGTSPSLMPPSAGSAIIACLNHNVPWMTFPEDLFTSFLTKTGYAGNDPDRADGPAVGYFGMVFQSDEVYDGDMTISLSPGPDIRIPNHQLVIPNYSIDSQGLIVEANSSSRELLINRLESATANHMPQLGRPFFSSAYLFVHQDQDQFTLWKGNPTVTERNLVSIGAPSCSSDVHTTSSSLNSTGSASTPQPADGKGSTNTGGIAGIVIGSLAGLAIVSLLIYRYCRRYKSRPPPPVSEPILDVRSQESAVPLYSSSTPGVPIHMQPPQELPLERNPSYVFGPFEMGETVNTKLMEQRR